MEVAKMVTRFWYNNEVFLDLYVNTFPPYYVGQRLQVFSKSYIIVKITHSIIEVFNEVGLMMHIILKEYDE